MESHPWRALALVASLVPLLSAPADAQAPRERTVPEGIACDRCTIRRSTIARLRSARIEGEIIELPFGVRMGPTGEYWVLRQGGGPLIHDSTGDYRRTIGRAGQGPSEFRSSDDVAFLPGDSVLVVDGVNRRASILSPAGRAVRTITLPATTTAIVVLDWPERVLAAASIHAPNSAGNAVHLLDLSRSSLEVVRSLEPRGGTTGREDPTTQHHIALAKSGDVFVASTHSPRILRWTSGGELAEAFTRRAPPRTAAGNGGPIGTRTDPPPSMTSALMVDDDGLLWVFTRVPAPTWRGAWADAPTTSSEVGLHQIAFGRLFNTRVEVIDPFKGNVVARTDLPGLVISALPHGRVAVYGPTALGTDEVRIDRLELMRPRPH